MLSKNELKDFLQKNIFDIKGNISASKLRCLDDSIIESISSYGGESMSENIYIIFYGVASCPVCGRKPKFKNFKKGFFTYCSTTCMANDDSLRALKMQTNINKYGVDNPSKNKEISNKIRNSIISRTDEEKQKSLEKRNKTCLEKYGTTNIQQVPEIIERKEASTLAHFGSKYYFSSEEFKKSHDYSLSKDSDEKSRETCFKRYGFEKPTKLFLNKIKETNLQRYGTEWYAQTKDSKENLRLKFSTLYDNIDKTIVLPLFEKDFFIKNGYLYYYDFECSSCHAVFKARMYNRNTPRCPKCFPKTKSMYEVELFKWISEFEYTESGNTSILNDSLELDIYIPSHNLAIEFDGLYWHTEQHGRNRDYHLNKTLQCQEKGMQLIHIFEDEWIEKQDIVKSIIKSKLGLYDQKIGARKCSIKEITSKEASQFYNKNHLQGGIKSSVNIGLFYNDDLVSCLSFAKPRFNKKYNWEITRFANKLDTQVMGAFNKLFKYFLTNYSGSIITYSDRRWFNGDIYRNNGFTYIGNSQSGYFYTDGFSRINRLQCQKHKLKNRLKSFDETLTEKENMENNRFFRIWDCGCSIFEYRR